MILSIIVKSISEPDSFAVWYVNATSCAVTFSPSVNLASSLIVTVHVNLSSDTLYPVAKSFSNPSFLSLLNNVEKNTLVIDPWPPVVASNPASGSSPIATISSLFFFLSSLFDTLSCEELDDEFDDRAAANPIAKTFLNFITINPPLNSLVFSQSPIL